MVVTHGTQKHKLEIDPSTNGETFKFQLYSVTGVEPERQKILVKGGQLKDDQDMSKLGFKPNQVLRMMGTPAAGAQALMKPTEQPKFLEDMTKAEAAQSEGATPAGLQNLGNTCYMNSTLQTLRAIPELQQELLSYEPAPSAGTPGGGLGDLSQFGLGGLGSSGDLTASLRDLYREMSETQEGFPPLMFLNAFRTAFPQFAEKSRDGRGYAQQDAEEAWSQLVTTLKTKLKPSGQAQTDGTPRKAFVDEYMGGKFENHEECLDPAAIEAGEKPQRKVDEVFYSLKCHVASKEVSHLSEGVTAALSSTYSKNSPTLARDAEYRQTSKISRLPKYLPVHYVRFFWKTNVNKKAKILRRVTFPHELDCVEYCTDDLRKKLLPVRDKVRELRKEEVDVERARKRQKRQKDAEDRDQAVKGKGLATEEKSKPINASSSSNAGASKAEKTADGEVEALEGEVFKTDAEIEAERAYQILEAKKALLSAVDQDLVKDKGSNQTGLYELRGVVTHQGASADSGHYTAYVKKEGRKNTKTGKREAEDGKWWWFNDEKVSEVDGEKIETLAGGGESHSALILLYRAVELPVLDEDVTMS